MTTTTRKKSNIHIYHILTKGNNKNNIFNEQQDYLKYLQILSHQKQTKGFELYGYCLKCNHVHLIIKELQEPISNLIKAINISYASYFNYKYNREGHLFQGRYQSDPINEPAELLGCLNYIHSDCQKTLQEYNSYNAYITNDSQLVDTNFLSFIHSINDQNQLQQKLNQPINKNYLFSDIDLRYIIEERASQYINQFLRKHQLMLYELNIPEYKPLRTELIVNLKSQHGLSVRKIAKLLNMNRNTVQRAKLEEQ